MKLGVPVSLQNALISIGGMIVQAVVNPMGVAFIAGYTATNKLYGLLELAAISYGNAISVFAGQNWGARRYARIRQGLWVDETEIAGQYPGKNLAEYMERMLYVCPKCGLARFESRGNRVRCLSCGLEAEYLPDKTLKSADPERIFLTVSFLPFFHM